MIAINEGSFRNSHTCSILGSSKLIIYDAAIAEGWLVLPAGFTGELAVVGIGSNLRRSANS